MTDKTPETQEAPSELETLKARADQMGISYRSNVTVETLRKKVNGKLNGETGDNDEDGEEPPAETENDRRNRLLQEAGKLVRIRVTCMNPQKRNHQGELFSCGNSVVGTHTKYVPFEEEWHVPQIILNQIKQRQCQVFYTERVDGKAVKRGKVIREFAVEELPPLTEAELKELAQRQAMANGTQ